MYDQSNLSWGKVPTVIGSAMLIGMPTLSALLHSTCDLKATDMNMQRSLIWELRL